MEQMVSPPSHVETFSAFPALYEGNTPVISGSHPHGDSNSSFDGVSLLA